MDPVTLVKAELQWYRVLVGPRVVGHMDLGRHIRVIFIIGIQPIRPSLGWLEVLVWDDTLVWQSSLVW
jgi:hypothetical protein